MNEEQIKYLCEIVRNDFDTSTLSKGSLIERMNTSLAIFEKLGINTNERVVNIVKEMQSDLDIVELW